jgi:8-oxo-dGTP pyrophosphatase MutT (NUDIX family)
MSDVAEIAEIEEIDCRYEPREWAFAVGRRPEIDAHWAKLIARTPAMFNGRVLVMHRRALHGTSFSGAYLDTDYASFLAWRDFGYPDDAVTNCFAMGALTSREGHYLLGIMGPHTANAGMIYFPAGTPDLDDIVGGKVDLSRNVLRELLEETGLVTGDVEVEPNWTMVALPPRIAFMRRLRSDLPSAELKARIEQNLTRQDKPELAGVHVVTGRPDLSDAMPAFQRAYLEHALRT